MKQIRSLWLIVIAVTFGLQTANSQEQLIWEDQGAILSKSAEASLVKSLADNDIEVVLSLDYKRRCEYHYAELTKTVNQISLKILDCNRNVKGSRTWTTKFFSMPEDEQVSRLVFAISEIVFEKDPVVKKETAKDDFFAIPFNHHSTRHFFSPTSFNLKRGEFYYSTIFFMTHDFQYGISDWFSVGMGTSSMLHPFYITPKFSFRADKKNSFAAGTMFMLGTWFPDFIGNLGYLTYTYGDEFNNVTLGLAHLYLEGGDNFNKIVNEPVINLSGMARLSDHVYFISENYFSGYNEKAWIYLPNLPPIVDNDIRTNVVAGMLGFRFISKKRSVLAFQFGLTYIQLMRSLDPLYEQYKDDIEYNFANWKRIVLPTFTFYTKLGNRI